MLSRRIKHCVLDTRWPTSALPPTFLLPLRSRYFNTTTPIIDGDISVSEPYKTAQLAPSNDKHTLSPSSTPSVSSQLPSSLSASSPTPTSTPAQVDPSSPMPPLSDSIKTLLPLLKAQSSHFITAHIHARPYLLTPGDSVRLPFLMHGVVPGDILRLNRASNIGSRDYTLKASGGDSSLIQVPSPTTPTSSPSSLAPATTSSNPTQGIHQVGSSRSKYLDERLFECRARVMGVESEPMRIMKKKKRRQRRTKTVHSKLKFTVLKLIELRVRDIEEIEAS
ncbi:MAG: hypothetical protein M1827_006914 [Pycnora praestabilis]|nr:MAG: hypothetical protein M1827_006914 [Pycnora praestabilis]